MLTWLVLRRGLFVTSLGVLAGLPLSIGAAAFVEPLLFRVAPADPVTHSTAVIVLGAADLLAGGWPAWRPAHLNALEALRRE